MPVFEERFGVRVQRELKTRGWNLGPRSRGHIALAVHPVRRGESLKFTPPPRLTYPSSYQVLRVDASIITPRASHEIVQEELGRSLGQVYPDAEIHFEIVEDSGHDTRWSILLVAHSRGSIRWGRDSLFSMPKNLESTREKFIQRACARLCEALYEETSRGGTVDEFLQDQLVAVQALAEGFSTFPRGGNSSQSADGLVEKLGTIEVRDGTGIRKDTHEQPFGNGSTHTTTARWVVSKLSFCRGQNSTRRGIRSREWVSVHTQIQLETFPTQNCAHAKGRPLVGHPRRLASRILTEVVEMA